MTPEPTETDLLVIGGGAAGLATAIFAARADPSLRVRCVDGARRLGAKILVSGGSRCNVTNRHVNADDFWGGSSRTVSRVLRAFPEGRTVEFFSGLGVALHEEEHGKLFPDTHRARTVLDALIREAEQRGVILQCERRVTEVQLLSAGFLVVTPCERFVATHLVLATGGLSLPKSGSDGGGYALAARLGHGHVQTTPALVPLLLDGAAHHELSGISHDVALTCRTGRSRIRIVGSLLWTHWGASGPAVLDVSRHWHRARLEADDATVSLSLCPSYTHDTLDAFLLEQREARPRALVRTVVAGLMPAAVADAWSASAGVAAQTSMSHLTREARRALVHALLETPLAVTGSRGYNHAEVTAGGVPLDEIDPASMASRVCPGLYLVGEILDVDGRLGGFNFQWAWSSAWVAGQAIGGRGKKTEDRRQKTGDRRQKARRAPMTDERWPVPAAWLVDHASLLPQAGAALDVACGRGRHALWLAARHLRVRAVDRDPDALAALAASARARGLQIEAQARDLELAPIDLGYGRYDLIVCVHYLHRPLFPVLLDALRPGGLLVYETFTRAQARRGKPTNPAFLLEPGELRVLTRGLSVVDEREGAFDGRDVASIVCRKERSPVGLDVG